MCRYGFGTETFLPEWWIEDSFEEHVCWECIADGSLKRYAEQLGYAVSNLPSPAEIKRIFQDASCYASFPLITHKYRTHNIVVLDERLATWVVRELLEGVRIFLLGNTNLRLYKKVDL